jgi:CMP-N,N'-diacetyllegionaminic acid synthase
MNGVLAIIPARGGSKGVKRKNLRFLNGRPLVQYPIVSAQSAAIFDRIVVSTDDDEISHVAIRSGAEVVRRPPDLSTDSSLVIDAIRYTVKELERANSYVPKIIFLLEPTSPFREREDMVKALEIIDSKVADSVASFRQTKLSPTRMWSIELDTVRPLLSGSDPFLPRQNQQIAYELTGEIYAFTRAKLLESSSNSVLLGKVAPLISSSEFSIDIDTELDFLVAETIINYKNEKS